MMNRQLAKDALGWGFVLWLIGYLLGILLFFMLPPALIGWVVMPIGIVITCWVLLRKIEGGSLRYYIVVAVVWTALAVILDYLLIVKALKPADGYYKPDVYLYYALTFLLPVTLGWWKGRTVHG